jgi:YggT family protein
MPEYVLGRIIVALASTLDYLLWAYFWIVLIAALLTWVNPDPRNPIVRFLYSVTEPVLHWIRRRLPFLYTSGIDFSPLVLLLGIQFTRSVLVASLFELAGRIAVAGAPRAGF